MIETVVTAFRAPDIRRKLLFTLGILLIFRALTNVPIPNVNTAALTDLFTNNPLLGILNIFSGGGLAAASIIGLGVNPYINASIIMQLMRGVIPALEELSREGEYGRNRINQYTRYLTVPLAFAQGYGISVLLSANGVIPANPLFSIETFSGEVDSDFPFTLQPNRDRRQGSRLEFNVGAGEARVTAESFSGGVVIRRATTQRR